MGLLYEELSYIVRGCIYEVHTEVGVGLDEESYQLALELKLKENNIPFRSQEIGYVKHRGNRVHKFVSDLIIDDQIILELKGIENKFHPKHTFQALSYLKHWKKQLGFLVNFGLPSVVIKRLPFTEKEGKLIEDYASVKNLITPTIRQPLTDLRAALLNIFKTHGLGYGEEVYLKILLEELSFNEMKYTKKAIIPVKMKNQFIKNYKIKWPIVNDQFICGIVALKEDLKLDKLKMKNYLKASNLEIGLLAHFGKHTLEIHGITKKK